MSADPKRTPFRLPNGSRIVVPPGAQTDARFIYAEIFDGRCYEQEGVTLAGSSVVLDVGANVGLFALRVLEAAPDARVLCFEPAPPTFACLAENTAPHPNIELQECALAHEPGDLTMTYFPRSPGNTSRHPELKLAEADAFAAHATLRWIFRFDKLGALFLALLYPLRRPLLRASFRRVYTGGVPFECRATTLDQVFGAQHLEAVDLLKVDVEGASARSWPASPTRTSRASDSWSSRSRPPTKRPSFLSSSDACATTASRMLRCAACWRRARQRATCSHARSSRCAAILCSPRARGQALHGLSCLAREHARTPPLFGSPT